jgi:hypothetical protein
MVSHIPCINSRNHPASAESFHQQDERHDREDVVVRRERGEPVYGQITDPYYQHRQINGKDPQHEN